MSCKDCYCGRREMEEAGRKVPEATCGPGPISAIVDAYEEGDITKETFIQALEMAIGRKE